MSVAMADFLYADIYADICAIAAPLASPIQPVAMFKKKTATAGDVQTFKMIPREPGVNSMSTRLGGVGDPRCRASWRASVAFSM